MLRQLSGLLSPDIYFSPTIHITYYTYSLNLSTYTTLHCKTTTLSLLSCTTPVLNILRRSDPSSSHSKCRKISLRGLEPRLPVTHPLTSTFQRSRSTSRPIMDRYLKEKDTRKQFLAEGGVRSNPASSSTSAIRAAERDIAQMSKHMGEHQSGSHVLP